MQCNEENRKPIPPFCSFTEFVPSIPKLYWNVKSQEQRILALCRQLHKLVCYVDFVGDKVNLNHEEIEKLKESIPIALKEYTVEELEKMAQDGTLAEILTPLLNSLITVFDTYHFHTLFATPYYRSNEREYGMQGGCVLPDNSIIQCTGDHGEFTGTVQHWATNGTQLQAVDVEYGHCNSVTYCDATDTVFITSTQNDDIGRYMVFEIDKETLTEISRYDLTDKGFPAEPYGFVYLPENDTFVWCNYWTETGEQWFWVTDREFNLQSTKQVSYSIRSNGNLNRFGNYLAVTSLSTQKMLLFTPTELNFFKEISFNPLVSYTWYITEPEWFDTRNGRIYIGFRPHGATAPLWGGGTKVVAYFDADTNYEESKRAQTNEFPPIREYYHVKYDQQYTPDRDGSADKPFMTIYEALNSALRNSETCNDVTIYFDDMPINDETPYFQMAKHYKLIANEVDFTSFSGFSIGAKATVEFNRSVALQGEAELNNLNLGAGNLQLAGKLYIYGSLFKQNSTKVKLSGSANCYAKIGLLNVGYDISNFYGTLENTRTVLFNTTDFLNYTPYSQGGILNKRFLGIKWNLTAEEDGTFVMPYIADALALIVKFKLPDMTENIEIPLVYMFGQYLDYIANPYSSGTKYHITISATGVLSFTNGMTNTRVKIESLR